MMAMTTSNSIKVNASRIGDRAWRIGNELLKFFLFIFRLASISTVMGKANTRG
jgi:hypothetical protein